MDDTDPNDPVPNGGDALDWTPQAMLEHALRNLNLKETETGERSDEPPDKAFTILLWDDDGRYTTRYFNCGMKVSEVVALLESIKYRLLADLGGDDSR